MSSASKHRGTSDVTIILAAKLLKRGRYVIFQIVEVAIPRQMFLGDFAADR